MSLALAVSRNLLRPARLLSSRLIASNFKTACAPLQTLGDAPKPKLEGMTPSAHWSFERLFNIGMLPLFPAAMLTDSPVVNMALVTALAVHTYWGINAVIVDYSMERVFGAFLQPLLLNLWRLIILVAWLGHMYYQHHGIGFSATIKEFWSL